MKIIKHFLFLCLFGSLCGCFNTKNAIYFNNLQDSVITRQAAEVEPVITRNDILNISVSSLSPDASSLFNLGGASAAPAGPSAQASGYLVDGDGLIQFPVLGHIKAAGLTKRQLADTLTKQLVNRQLLVDPIISVRQANFHVTVLGDVGRPGVIPVPNERISILEAIGNAGDLTIQSKRNNVLLIREEGGKKITRRIDLNASDIFTSPYYHLRSNDIVYVEPSALKIKNANRKQPLFPIILSTISISLLLADRIFK
ncbi:polysaccharide biosynthesis/export family protein [Paraflavisolibacter sp. H34]|uniref:polysaccharide biosynthesis/export family protein n=1 Tax=Huijunlia imazamoxiresistens TaxID=3127457 RepID=UPI0030199267